MTRPPSAANGLNRVLILSAAAGAGHVRAGQALERALVATGRVGEVRHVDVLQYTMTAVTVLLATGASPNARHSTDMSRRW